MRERQRVNDFEGIGRAAVKTRKMKMRQLRHVEKGGQRGRIYTPCDVVQDEGVEASVVKFTQRGVIRGGVATSKELCVQDAQSSEVGQRSQ